MTDAQFMFKDGCAFHLAYFSNSKSGFHKNSKQLAKDWRVQMITWPGTFISLKDPIMGVRQQKLELYLLGAGLNNPDWRFKLVEFIEALWATSVVPMNHEAEMLTAKLTSFEQIGVQSIAQKEAL